MQLLKVSGHQKIKSRKELNLSSILAAAIKSKGLYVETAGSKRIVFSHLSPMNSLFRYDWFSGVRSGDIRILPDGENQKTINFSLDISSSSYLLFFVTFGNMLTWPIFNTDNPYSFVRVEMTILLLGVAAFFLQREFVRFMMNHFIRGTFKHLR